ncbi:sulfatase family protein [Paenibacillus sacheonensis]|uniref:Sulfatase-like hydrolase/transferase n=1 Tax=Paenibacillus sacheonensis TaxID=742054 RepID=A0A7X4YKR2_9BACL|nr:sulfatase [Paenibacillus sacheonensis]MBM7563226.1 arylsulfatase A-like enzyme [Paenibacillus sacheonensis]NBC68213.1 sulfatase-like hydrolase/transferase [Paenibacillus sacheonensis]
MKIILISLDTLRASRLSGYGYGKRTSPHMDQIARDGVLFERAYAADIPTEVAHTGVFTGKIGLTTGVVSHGSDLTNLPKSVEWLPNLLRSAGFTTGAVDNLYQLKEWFARGYNYYLNTVGGNRWIDGSKINDMAFPWIEQHKDESFFLFLHYWDAHTPYLPPDSYVPEFYDAAKDPFDPANKSMEPAYNHTAYPFFKHHHYDLVGQVTDTDYYDALYDAEIRYLDDRLKELDDHLAKLGIQEETLLVLFGDHGESLTEHDIYWDHCGLYEPTVHVPLILRWPGRLPAGRRVPGLVQQADILPTLLEAVRREAPDGIATGKLADPAGLDGRSLWKAIEGRADGTRETLYLSECAWQAARAIRNDRYKLIVTYDSGPFRRPPRELYDLASDPLETVNLAELRPDIADALEGQLNAFVAEKLDGDPDPMKEQLARRGLPFRRRIEQILNAAGLTWEQWQRNPDRKIFDKATSDVQSH